MNPRSVAVLLAAVVLSSCSKDAVREIAGPAAGAQIKFYNFSLNAPSVNFYANDAKLTATSSTTGVESTTGTAYGSVGNAGLYSAIAPGAYTFYGRSPAAGDNNLAIATLPGTLADGKYYSLYLGGFYNTTTKLSDAFLLEDAFPTAIDFAITSVRFVNASPNSQPMQLFAKSTVTGIETPVGSAVAYQSATPFVTYSPAAYDLSVRLPGSSINLIVRTGVSLVGGRVYTISARGDMTVTSTTATNRPVLDNTTNR
jgi:hypothetical protein